MKGVVWVSVKIGLLIGAGIQKLYVGAFAATATRRVKVSPQQKSEADENRRIAGCETVVRNYANALGYIARECITREELAEKIDGGISPEELEGEIQKRMWEKPGIILGTHLPDRHTLPVKLSYAWRDRHVYIIGKSGYGKTNLLRTMIFQDLDVGNSVGVLAPEQEFLFDEILPYIPEDRIDDVVFVNPTDTEYPVSFNPLHLDEGEDIEQKVDNVVTIFKRVMEGGGARMDEILWQSLKVISI